MIVTIILLIITYLLNIVDYLQTTYTIQRVGLRAELNPIMRYVFEHNCALAFKVILPAILLIAMGIIVKVDRKSSWTVYVLAALYLLVVMHNFAMLVQAGIF